MATIVIVRGTGYTGANIAREAASRGHAVVSISRSQPRGRCPACAMSSAMQNSSLRG